MKIIEEKDFEDEVKSGIVIVDFFATWCGPCRVMGQILERMEEDLKDVKILKVDVDECEKLSRQFGVLSIPTIVFFKDGNMVRKNVGIMSEEEVAEEIEKMR